MEAAARGREGRKGRDGVAMVPQDGASQAVVKPPSQATPSAWYDEVTPLKEREHLSPWHVMAIIYQQLYGVSFREFCNQFRAGKGAESLRKVSQSPAAARLKEQIAEITDDVPALIKLAMENHQMTGFGVHLQALQMATQAKDYKAMHQMVKDIAMAPALSKLGKEAEKTPPPMTLNLNIAGAPAGAEVSLDFDEPETIDIEVDMDEDEEDVIDYG